MPQTQLQVLQLRPGINREGTSYSGEGGWYDCDKIRFRSGLPEKIGGWMPLGNGSYEGVCRHYTQWASLSNFLLIGVGTNTNYYILTGGEYFDITPVVQVDTLNAPPGDPVYAMYSVLTSAISATDDVIPVAFVDASNFNLVTPVVVKIGSELIYVPAVDTVANTLGTAASGCTRGYLGTTATSHALNAGVSSSWLVVKDISSPAVAGDTVVISGATGFSDLLSTENLNVLMTESGLNLIATEQDVVVDVYTAADINGEHIVVAANSSYFAFDTGIYSTAPAQGGGNSIVVGYLLPSGLFYQGVLNGWGAGPWNSDREWNQAYVSYEPGYEIRLWSASNFGQNLFFNARNNGIFNWNAATSLNAVGQVTQRAVNITSTAFSNITLDRIVVGNYYQIRDLGTTTQLQWNTLAGTSAVTYAAGSKFFCADVIAAGYGTGIVFDPAIPSVATCVLSTDKRHVVAFGCNDAVTEVTTGAPVQQDTMYIAWCSQGEPQVWWPTQTNSAGDYRLTVGSRIITVAETRQETLVFTDLALYSMQYLGAPFTFGFNVIDTNTTIASPNAFATANNITYWMGQDKFFAYSGRVDTLPCSLRQYVFDDINFNQIEQVYCGTNEKYNEVWWFYPSKNSLMNDRYVVYNHLEKLWYYGQLTRTAWLDSYALEQPLAAVPNISNILEPVGITVEHEVGADDGSVNPIQPISAYIQSSDFDLGEGGYQFSFVKRIIPDMDFIGSTTTTPNAQITLTARNYPGIGVNTDPMQATTVPINGSQVNVQVYNYTEQEWIRLRGRQLQFRIESSDLGVRWQLGSPRLQISPDGRR